jgi:hypothetical protein
LIRILSIVLFISGFAPVVFVLVLTVALGAAAAEIGAQGFRLARLALGLGGERGIRQVGHRLVAVFGHATVLGLKEGAAVSKRFSGNLPAFSSRLEFVDQSVGRQIFDIPKRSAELTMIRTTP